MFFNKIFHKFERFERYNEGTLIRIPARFTYRFTYTHT